MKQETKAFMKDTIMKASIFSVLLAFVTLTLTIMSIKGQGLIFLMLTAPFNMSMELGFLSNFWGPIIFLFAFIVIGSLEDRRTGGHQSRNLFIAGLIVCYIVQCSWLIFGYVMPSLGTSVLSIVLQLGFFYMVSGPIESKGIRIAVIFFSMLFLLATSWGANPNHFWGIIIFGGALIIYTGCTYVWEQLKERGLQDSLILRYIAIKA